jgi:hypothetical protein
MLGAERRRQAFYSIRQSSAMRIEQGVELLDEQPSYTGVRRAGHRWHVGPGQGLGLGRVWTRPDPRAEGVGWRISPGRRCRREQLREQPAQLTF